MRGERGEQVDNKYCVCKKKRLSFSTAHQHLRHLISKLKRFMQSSELFIISHKKNICIILKLTVQIAIPESHGGNQVLKIQDFSSDGVMEARDILFSSPILYNKSKIIN